MGYFEWNKKDTVTLTVLLWSFGGQILHEMPHVNVSSRALVRVCNYPCEWLECAVIDENFAEREKMRLSLDEQCLFIVCYRCFDTANSNDFYFFLNNQQKQCAVSLYSYIENITILGRAFYPWERFKVAARPHEASIFACVSLRLALRLPFKILGVESLPLSRFIMETLYR